MEKFEKGATSCMVGAALRHLRLYMIKSLMNSENKQPRKKRTSTESSIWIRIEREVSGSVYLKSTLYFSKFDSILRYFLEYLFRRRIARHHDFEKMGFVKKNKNRKKRCEVFENKETSRTNFKNIDFFFFIQALKKNKAVFNFKFYLSRFLNFFSFRIFAF